MSGTFELTAASPDDGLDVLRMLHEIGRGENGFTNDAHDLSPDAWREYLARLVTGTQAAGLTPGRVPQTTYWLRRDGLSVGVSKLRHTLNDALRIYGGHVGYCVRPGERGKGYGHILLGKTLEEARRLGLTRVLITVDRNNKPSRALVERQGGVLELDETVSHCRYWVPLESA